MQISALNNARLTLYWRNTENTWQEYISLENFYQRVKKIDSANSFIHLNSLVYVFRCQGFMSYVDRRYNTCMLS